MPENWKHYIGVDLNKPQKTVDRIMESKAEIMKIAQEGNRWAIENYSPEASAKRLIKTISA